MARCPAMGPTVAALALPLVLAGALALPLAVVLALPLVTAPVTVAFADAVTTALVVAVTGALPPPLVLALALAVPVPGLARCGLLAPWAGPAAGPVGGAGLVVLPWTTLPWLQQQLFPLVAAAVPPVVRARRLSVPLAAMTSFSVVVLTRAVVLFALRPVMLMLSGFLPARPRTDSDAPVVPGVVAPVVGVAVLVAFAIALALSLAALALAALALSAVALSALALAALALPSVTLAALALTALALAALALAALALSAVALSALALAALALPSVTLAALALTALALAALALAALALSLSVAVAVAVTLRLALPVAAAPVLGGLPPRPSVAGPPRGRTPGTRAVAIRHWRSRRCNPEALRGAGSPVCTPRPEHGSALARRIQSLLAPELHNVVTPGFGVGEAEVMGGLEQAPAEVLRILPTRAHHAL